MPKKKKQLKPIVFKDSWAKPVAKVVKDTLADVIYKSLLDALEEADPKENAKLTPLERALKNGEIRYVNGIFTGKMSAALSSEIKALGGKFINGKWRLIEAQMTPDLRKAVEANKSMLRRLAASVNERLTAMAENARNAIEEMSIKSLGIYAMDRTSDEFKSTVVKAMSVQPQKTLQMEGKKLLEKDYLKTRDLPIKQRLASEMESAVKQSSSNFSYTEIVKLREELSLMIASGAPRKDVKKYIESRLKISANRAKFIARQETSLYTSKLKESQYKQAGIDQYIWKTVGDRRVRHDHKILNNKKFSWDNPPIIDERTGQRGHPGVAYNCRCNAQPIVEW